MIILVVDHNRQERDTTVSMLTAAENAIDSVADAKSALTFLDTRTPDVIVIEATLPGVSGTELVKRIRARESISHAYIVVTSAKQIVGDLKAAFQAGADDFLRKPCGKDELVARVDGLNRIRRWAPVVFGAGARDDLGSGGDLSGLHAWKTVESIVTSDVADMLGMTFDIATSERSLDAAELGALLPLTIAAEGIEVCVAVGVDSPTQRALAEVMLGNADAPNAELCDMMREIGNVAAGAFKRMAAAEGKTFTTGLPQSRTSFDGFRRPAAKGRQSWIATSAGSPIQLRFEVEIRIRSPKRVLTTDLQEGMVVTCDLLNDTGALVLRGGTRLTESHLGHLPRILGAKRLVDVMDSSTSSERPAAN